MLSKKEILEWNKKLKEPFKNVSFFEEGHRYEIKGMENRPVKSVSALIKFLYEPFNTDKIAPKWSKERGLDVDDVKLAWQGEGDIANAHGSKVHLVGENYVKWKYFGSCERPIIFDKQSLGAIQFINDLPDYLIPVATELIMFSPLYFFTGTCDGVLYNTKTGKFILYDYKTNKALTDEEYKQPYLKHIDKSHDLRQDNFGKYSAQFSFYQLQLEEAGFEVGGRILVWLREDKPNKKLYQTFKTKNITNDLKTFLHSGLHL